ncbi:MAG TPA: inner-membrane translocator [Chloroflexia bacterium]|nr:inner-membrane translocator [Chloroflexia bacterium]
MSNAMNEEPGGRATAPTVDAAQPSASSALATDERLITKRGIRGYLKGDLGFAPVLITLIIVAIYFQFASAGVFLAPTNLSNLALQIVTIGTLGIAAVLVLLLGEIDLSLAAVSQACAAICGVLIVRQGLPAWLGVILAILIGTIIGLANGFFISTLRIPSFIVTLSGSLAYAGLLLTVLLPQTTLQVRDPWVSSLSTTYLSPVLGIGLPIAIVAIYIALTMLNRQRRARTGLRVASVTNLGLKFGAIILVTALVLIGFHIETSPGVSGKGVPQSTAIWIGLILIVWMVLKFTSFGRHVYAVGGNAEASRRAGINVGGVRIAVFALASTLAAIGGILQLSRAGAADAAVNPTLLLNSIAAAVIGGVSLFGGRGSVWAVVLGALVIGSIENGLNLLSQGQDVKYIVEGLVLLLAVTADALLRRANATSGR